MSPGSSSVAVIVGAESETAQQLLAAAASECRSAGVNVSGVVAESHGLPDRSCSAGVLRDLVSGRAHPTYLETAPTGTSCHLDAGGVDTACASVLEHLQTSDLVILSKFGKLEAMRQGLFPAFEAAVSEGKPLITTVSKKHEEAWEAFAPNATFVEADRAAIAHWWRSVLENRH